MIDSLLAWKVRVVRGRGDPEEMVFADGDDEGPVSVGRKGKWKIAGDGVEDVHVFLHDDKGELRVLKVHATAPALLEDVELPAAWTPMTEGAELRLGEVVLLAVRSDVPHDEAVRPGGPAGRAPNERPLGLQTPMRPAAPPPTRILDLASVWKEDPSIRIDATPPGAVQGEPVPTAIAEPIDKGFMASWRRAPAPRKFLAIMVPITLIAVAARGQPLVASVVARFIGPAAPIAASAPKARVIATSEPAAAPKVASTVPSAPAANRELDPAPAPGASATTEATPPARAEPDAKSTKHAASAAPAEKTDERQAADRVAAADYASAVKIYQALAAANPNRPVFRDAVRILREKMARSLP